MSSDPPAEPDEQPHGDPPDVGDLGAPEQWRRVWKGILSLADWHSAVDVLGTEGLEEYRTLFTELPPDHRSRVVSQLKSFKGMSAGQAVLAALARASFMVEDAQYAGETDQGEQGGAGS